MHPSTIRKTVWPQWADRYLFPITMWLFSRLTIIVALQLIAPLEHNLPADIDRPTLGYVANFVPKASWELFSHWDGAWYRKIATIGYDYANDRQPHAVVFFPLFPLLTRGVMAFGLSFEVAGTLVNNLAFLGALLLLYRWTEEHQGSRTAKWATAVLAWFPLSLYGTILYTEGLFLLLTTAALRTFDKGQYAWAAFWGAMATATRPTGVVLIPTFLFITWRTKRPIVAYAASFATGGGLLLFMVYCAIRFADPLAFVHAQQGWEQVSWVEMFAGAFALKKHSLLIVIMFFGGSYLLWSLRTKLPLIAVAYGFCSIALFLASGTLDAIHRYVYGTVSLSMALGVLLVRYPRWGYVIMGLFATVLVRLTIKFAWWQWVAFSYRLIA